MKGEEERRSGARTRSETDVGAAPSSAASSQARVPAGRASAVESPLRDPGRARPARRRGVVVVVAAARFRSAAVAPARRSSSSVRGGGSRGAAPRRPGLLEAGGDPGAKRCRERERRRRRERGR